MLIDFLDGYPNLAQEADIGDIPDYATEGIRANGNILFNQAATRRVLAECWNEVEIALDGWREANGSDFPVKKHRTVARLRCYAAHRNGLAGNHWRFQYRPAER
jgi:hypothetical protein